MTWLRPPLAASSGLNLFFICYRPWKLTVVPESSNVRTLIVMLKRFFSHYTLQIGYVIFTIHRKISLGSGIIIKIFWETSKKLMHLIINQFVLYVSESTDISIMALSVVSINSISKVLLTQQFHCIPYQYETSKTGFQVLWIVSNLDLIWRYVLLQVICRCMYRICCYSTLTAVRALPERLRASCTFYWSPRCCTFSVFHESRNMIPTLKSG